MRRIDWQHRAENLVLFFADRPGRERGRRLHRHEAKNLEEMRHHHVAKSAGLLVETNPVADIERLRHVDLHMIDEIAVPDRLEQAVAEAKGENVLRRLLAEEMIDAENLVLGEHLVQRIVERDRAFEIGAERLFHDDARPAGKLSLAQHLDRRQGGVRRHAQIVHALGLLGEGLLSSVDRFLESAGAGRDRHVVEQRFERRPGLLLRVMGVLLEDGLAGESAEALRVERVERYADDPAFRDEAGAHEMKEARQQLFVGEISGRAEQDDDLRQFGAYPRRYLRHCHPHRRPFDSALNRASLSRVRTTETRQAKTSRATRFHRRSLRLAQPSSSIRSARSNPCARQDASTPGTSARSRPETIASPSALMTAASDGASSRKGLARMLANTRS